ncbi:kelch domain-containing protein 3 [Neocloeon triangulifer]|uniref:kelch domain-containing protein 3 n=1 Tax=Neocloeon triangulifer TaxID=2078957 RepID=UPI00286FA02E|nr:kelch domain-containing protein 3 [Neocloeon triangulifer]
MLRWTVHLEGGPQRVNHAAVAIGGCVFSFGGYCTGDNYRVVRPIDVHALNTSTYRWMPVAVQDTEHITPFQRYGHTVVAFEGKVYLWGGRNDLMACNTLYCFNPATRSWTAPVVTGQVPNARDGHSACVLGHCMYIFGGFEEEFDRFTQDVYCLDLTTMQWHFVRTKGSPPSYRDFHTASAIGHCMYIFGGRGDVSGQYHSYAEVYCNKITYLDTVTRTWHELETTGQPPPGRRSHSMFVYKGSLYMFGGYNGNSNLHFNDLFCFDPRTNNWTELKPLGIPPCPRRRQSCCLCGDRVFLFGGTSPKPAVPMEVDGIQDNSPLQDHNDLHVLDFAPTLKTLCFLAMGKHKIDCKNVPSVLIRDFAMMTSHNNITNITRPEHRG